MRSGALIVFLGLWLRPGHRQRIHRLPRFRSVAPTAVRIVSSTVIHSGSAGRIRIADIDTPELSPPRCEAERIKGEAAKARLLYLLNAGKFSLSAGLRDEDKYGRKLRTVTRAGHSLGSALIDEHLARRWDGARHGWCG